MLMLGFIGVYILVRFGVIGLLLHCQKRRRQEEPQPQPRTIPTAEEMVDAV